MYSVACYGAIILGGRGGKKKEGPNASQAAYDGKL